MIEESKVNNEKYKFKEFRGITLISLVITVIVLIILASVAIYLSIGESGIFTKTKEAKEVTNKQEATDIINLKITTAQMNKYAEKEEMPTLQELADILYEDNEIEYVALEKTVASKEKIIVGNNTSIYTKLNKYPYEFEINSKLQLASINGVKVANSGDANISEETLNSMFYPNTRMQLTLSNNTVTIPRNGWLYLQFFKEPTGDAFYAYRNGKTIMMVACPTQNTGDSAYIPVKKDDIIVVSNQSYFTLYLDYYENVEE